MLFSIVGAPFYIPINSMQAFQCLHILTQHLLFFLNLFLYFERDSVHMSLGGTEREGETEPKQALCCQSDTRLAGSHKP